MTPKTFRSLVLAREGVVEGAHMGHADFRLGKRVIATLGNPDDDWAMVKLRPEQQEMLVSAEPEVFRPANGAWGRQGSTLVRLKLIDAKTARSAISMAWSNVSG